MILAVNQTVSLLSNHWSPSQDGFDCQGLKATALMLRIVVDEFWGQVME